MRILFVWLTALMLVFIITVSWYVSQGVVSSIANGLLSDATGQGENIRDLVLYANIIWGPLFSVLVVIWAIVSSQANSAESRYM